MDSSVPQSNSTWSPSSDIADNTSMKAPFKRDIFLSTYHRQNFTFPNSIVYLITKNTKVYQKMVQCCKYFFIKNPILVYSELYYDDDNGWNALFKGYWKNIDINTISAKLWITDEIFYSPEDVNNNSVVSSITPKIYQCDATEIYLSHQDISYREFTFLCSSAQILTLEAVTVKNDDGTVVLFDKLIEQLPQIKEIDYTFTTPSNNTSKAVFKELWKISHLSNYDYFALRNIPEDFDIDSFYSYMKKNKNTRILLEFSDPISEESETRLEAIVDEIIGTKNHEYKPPFIDFPELDEEKFNELNDIYSS